MPPKISLSTALTLLIDPLDKFALLDKDISTIPCMSSLIYNRAVSKYMEYISLGHWHACSRAVACIECFGANFCPLIGHSTSE
jgi:hypothetical protein